jgi:hypothetical protein
MLNKLKIMILKNIFLGHSFKKIHEKFTFINQEIFKISFLITSDLRINRK